MQTITEGYQSVSLLVQLNWDRLFYVAAIAAALFAGTAVGTVLNAGLHGGM